MKELVKLTVVNVGGDVLEEMDSSLEALKEATSPGGRLRLSNGFDYSPVSWQTTHDDFIGAPRCRVTVVSVV